MITVTILTKNNEETLGSVLESTKNFDEVVLLDAGSTDATLEIASLYPNVKIFHSPFIGFGPLHNLAAHHASNDWILSLDSDEVLTLELAQEILLLQLDIKKVYSFPFHNYFNGKHIKWCGWHPDRHIRLYHKQATTFSNDKVHEKIQTAGLSEIKLHSPIKHYSYRSISDFLLKMELYSNLFAEQNAHKKKSSFTKALIHGFFAFIKSYLLKRGFLGGQEGYIISLYNAQTAFYKYLKLAYASRSSLSQDRY
ncbi:MAG: glycosyltransferase family 2 protein [Simkaniaceae bacterium]|nr:glycosyltransferase family 2 protein [Simkaniaceae bacterium]